MAKDAFSALAQALQALPGLGERSARRVAYALLQHKRVDAEHLLQTLTRALKEVRHCQRCNTLCEEEVCDICKDRDRDASSLMIVQMPFDISIIEKARCHTGYYFVLMGAISPLKQQDLSYIALDALQMRLKDPALKEVIIGTNFNGDGEATAYVLQEILSQGPFIVSRLARGVPLGGELEFTDAGTLAQSFYDRKVLE
ncbi:MAG: recombination protein RecR [Haemophilus parainfluenzae]|jgi:recombination protein recR|nr:MAG: recombination protein RecR [Haemophilus parainfluenzae]